MSPLGGEPRVVEVMPAGEGANVERGLYGIELVDCAGNACAIRNNGSGHDGAEEARACGILESLKAAAERIDEAVLRCGVGEIAVDFVTQCIVDDIGENFVGCGTFVANVRGHADSL